MPFEWAGHGEAGGRGLGFATGDQKGEEERRSGGAESRMIQPLPRWAPRPRIAGPPHSPSLASPRAFTGVRGEDFSNGGRAMRGQPF